MKNTRDWEAKSMKLKLRNDHELVYIRHVKGFLA